ncbi:FecR family protein [Colwellia psychrerythraea]|uniref:Anti-FecI sigma factor, FecR n=1 Tax=Colwellia psychrerythraea TaxID=28229 RepID=A0A099KE47_COLPS|nr:FecR domain-containing protein [Colwellia psychrerythraea]KGJ88302.1 anti-FecI sigma factor, FecR [Colwellia psychrerythraea]
MKNKIIPIFTDNVMKEEASVWLAKLDRGLTDNEEVLLKDWLSQSEKRREYFVKLAKQWDVLSVLSLLSDVVPYNKQKTNLNFRHVMMAASVFFLLLLNMPSLDINRFFDTNGTASTSVVDPTLFSRTYETAVGEKSTINLPDLSVLTLNTDSIVEVKYTQKNRFLLLKKGELFIDVAHNKQRELIVSAGEKSFVAVGTAFNVSYLDKSKLELIVTEGKVLIAEKTAASNATRKVDNRVIKSIGVVAGEKVLLKSNEKLMVAAIQKVNIKDSLDSSLSWRAGKLVFKGETLDNVIAEVSRYSNVQIELVGDEIKKIRIGGRFRTGDVDGLLNVLTEQFDIEISKMNNSKIKLYLTAKKLT